jgi:hypothetical protein
MRMLRSGASFAALLMLAMAGCDDLTVPADDHWEAVLESRPGSDVVGGAVALSASERTRVTAGIRQAGAGESLPWHIHAGSCETGGAILGDPTAFPPLEVGADGRAEAWTMLSYGLHPDQPYHVKVHRSSEDLATVLACGDLVLR